MTETAKPNVIKRENDNATNGSPHAQDEAQNSPKPPHFETDTNVNNDEISTESGGRGGLDPSRYGDWEKAGRCIDF